MTGSRIVYLESGEIKLPTLPALIAAILGEDVTLYGGIDPLVAQALTPNVNDTHSLEILTESYVCVHQDITRVRHGTYVISLPITRFRPGLTKRLSIEEVAGHPFVDVQTAFDRINPRAQQFIELDLLAKNNHLFEGYDVPIIFSSGRQHLGHGDYGSYIHVFLSNAHALRRNL